MLIAVFSDIHGNYQALDSILRDIKSKKVDKIICLGDAVAFGPDSKKCIELIYENNIEFVHQHQNSKQNNCQTYRMLLDQSVSQLLF